jgi:pyrophosphate--fructose-6-phosphate 1-phosphotransferase
MASPLQTARQKYIPKRPKLLQDVKHVLFREESQPTSSLGNAEKLNTLFPHTFGRSILRASHSARSSSSPLRIGVIFSGGPAAGGHNVIAGVFDAMKELHPDSQLFGFSGGPSGVVSGKHIEITASVLSPYRNMGGFDLLGSGRTKIETQEQFEASLKTVQTLRLNGLIIIGGDDSNTNAAALAEYFTEKGCSTCVAGVPKTIDGDLQGEEMAISFGFDTACKVYSEMIGNIARDVKSAKKYYLFIKLMGRSASHIALECALRTHPNAVLIGEDVAARNKTLTEITQGIADLICKRAEGGKQYGLILIPEGLIEFIPEMKALIKALVKSKEIPASLQPVWAPLPEPIKKQLLYDRDPHGNINVSAIETEQLLIATVGKELEKRAQQGTYRGSFNPLSHFFGYEGRAAFPSNFDATYGYALGMAAALLVENRKTGYICCIQRLDRPTDEWQVAALPLTSLMCIEERKGVAMPVIRKTLVDLEGSSFSALKAKEGKWAIEDDYQFPGPIQFFGDPLLTESVPLCVPSSIPT